MITTLRRCGRALTTNRARFNLTLGIAIVGLLFWARLIVIADMPRTAIADPDPQPAANPEPGSNDASDNESDAESPDETEALEQPAALR